MALLIFVGLLAMPSFGQVREGPQDFEYFSSVDGVRMGGVMYVPKGYDPNGPRAGLISYLHGGGGRGVIPQDWPRYLDDRGWILIAPHGRAWGLFERGCPWRTSAAYVNNWFDADVGPGEQDILDAIDWAIENFNIDTDRVYLSGFSMGGRGTYIIGLRNPDRFAAIAPLAPASDMYEIFVRRPEPRVCKEGMVSDGKGGGQPGDSLVTDTLYTITSGRFLIENAHNLPVFHGHGTADMVAFNVLDTPNQYLHGAHMLFDTTWKGCHGETELCFGHTPTLLELHSRHPEGYDWDYLFTEVEHIRDPVWTPAIFAFFDAHRLVRSPNTVTYKSYTEEHRRAYWAEIDITTPWLNVPGAIRATRHVQQNRLRVQLCRVDRFTIDVLLAGLRIASAARPLTIQVEPLYEPVYDPALSCEGEPLRPTVVLQGIESTRVAVYQDGVRLPPDLVTLKDGTLEIGPIDASTRTTLRIVNDPRDVP